MTDTDTGMLPEERAEGRREAALLLGKRDGQRGRKARPDTWGDEGVLRDIYWDAWTRARQVQLGASPAPETTEHEELQQVAARYGRKDGLGGMPRREALLFVRPADRDAYRDAWNETRRKSNRPEPPPAGGAALAKAAGLLPDGQPPEDETDEQADGRPGEETTAGDPDVSAWLDRRKVLPDDLAERPSKPTACEEPCRAGLKAAAFLLGKHDALNGCTPRGDEVWSVTENRAAYTDGFEREVQRLAEARDEPDGQNVEAIYRRLDSDRDRLKALEGIVKAHRDDLTDAKQRLDNHGDKIANLWNRMVGASPEANMADLDGRLNAHTTLTEDWVRAIRDWIGMPHGAVKDDAETLAEQVAGHQGWIDGFARETLPEIWLKVRKADAEARRAIRLASRRVRRHERRGHR